MGADAANDAGQGKISQDDFHRFPVFALGDEGHVGMSIDLVGACIGAGRAVTLINAVTAGNCLRVQFEGGLARRQPLIELIIQRYGTNLGALTASGAFLQVHIPGSFPHSRGKVPRFTFESLDLRHGHQLHIQMTPRFNELG